MFQTHVSGMLKAEYNMYIVYLPNYIKSVVFVRTTRWISQNLVRNYKD